MFGLVFVEVSVSQMLRGAAVVFVAILKHFVVGDKLKPYMWVGVFFCLLSVVVVGFKAMTDKKDIEADEDMKNPAIGVALILGGALVQSLQYVFEEMAMSDKEDTGAAKVPPFLLIGMEGLWGLVVCTLIMYPIFSSLPSTPLYEDPADTLHMFLSNSMLQQVFAGYFLAVMFFNVFSVLVTDYLNSLWKTIINLVRPLVVWLVNLFVHYCVDDGYGERWTPWSFLQLLGLAMLVAGISVYNGSVKVPGFDYDSVEDDPAAINGYGIRTPESMATPALTKSPLMGKTRGLAASYGPRGGEYPSASSGISIDFEMAQPQSRRMSTAM